MGQCNGCVELEARLQWFREHADQLDKNWEAVHEAAMKPIREASGNPEATVPEIIARISALTEQRDRLREACEALPLDHDLSDAADYKDNAWKFDLAMDLARAALASIPE